MAMTAEDTRATNGDTRKAGDVDSDLIERIHALEVAQATQAAVATGAQATQAAITTGMQAAQATAQAGTWAVMTVGSIAFVVGSVLGALVVGARR